VRRLLKIFTKAGILWQTHSAPRLGAALAFYTVLSLAPLLIVAVGVTSVFLSRAEVQQGIIEQVEMALGPESDQIVRVLQSLFANAFRAYQTSTGIITSAIGFVVLLFGASLVFVELRAAANILWGVKPAASRRETILTFLWNRVLSIGLIVGIGILLVGTLTLSTYLSAGWQYLREHAVSVVLLQLLETTFGFVLLLLVLALLFKYLPSAKVRWREVWLGAVVTALLFLLGRWLMGAYIAESALSSAYGAAGSLVVFLLWMFYSAQIFFFGVSLCRAVRDTSRNTVLVVRNV
jgi:membrane protein